ncbi:hypothetical protein B0H14DRAFT_3861288, partial [Mycena olivaceomarginata]
MSAATHPNFHLVPAHTSEVHLSTVRSLFTAYTKWLDLDLTFQNYAAELAALPGTYAPPSGALLLALDTDSSTPLSIIALQARGRGMARALRLDIEGYNPEGAGFGMSCIFAMNTYNVFRTSQSGIECG